VISYFLALNENVKNTLSQFESSLKHFSKMKNHFYPLNRRKIDGIRQCLGITFTLINKRVLGICYGTSTEVFICSRVEILIIGNPNMPTCIRIVCCLGAWASTIDKDWLNRFNLI
jgi:hypothetical protein